MMDLQIQSSFAYVLVVAVASAVVHHIYMAQMVMKARKAFGVKYPALYADKDNCPDADKRNRFNCVQRAHQNSLEIQPIFLVLLVLAGLRYPFTAAALGVAFLAGRLSYAHGYSSGTPARRINPGTMLFVVGLLGLQITCLKFAADLLLKS